MTYIFFFIIITIEILHNDGLGNFSTCYIWISGLTVIVWYKSDLMREPPKENFKNKFCRQWVAVNFEPFSEPMMYILTFLTWTFWRLCIFLHKKKSFVEQIWETMTTRALRKFYQGNFTNMFVQKTSIIYLRKTILPFRMWCVGIFSFTFRVNNVLFELVYHIQFYTIIFIKPVWCFMMCDVWYVKGMFKGAPKL